MGESLPLWAKLLLQFVNFGILVFILVKFGGKPLKDFLRKRHIAVKEKIEEADRLLKEAERAKLTYEDRLSGLDGEIEEFRKAAMEAMENERKRVLDEAYELARRIREQARLAYDQEMKEAMAKVQADIAGGAVKAAEQRVRQMFTQEDHDKMVEEFIEKARSAN
jgi:F-type H+-transporting ATPase subunit b